MTAPAPRLTPVAAPRLFLAPVLLLGALLPGCAAGPAPVPPSTPSPTPVLAAVAATVTAEPATPNPVPAGAAEETPTATVSRFAATITAVSAGLTVPPAEPSPSPPPEPALASPVVAAPPPGPAGPFPVPSPFSPFGLPSPLASPTADLLWAERFQNPSSGFPSGRASSGVAEHRYDLEQGEYVIRMLRAAEANVDASVWDAVINVYETFGDFQLEVEGRQVGTAPNGAWGVLFRAQDFANYYKVSVDPNSGQFEFYKLVADRRTDFAAWRPSAAIQPGGAPNRIGVTARGAQLVARINGVPVATTTDTSFVEGRVGFIVNVWSRPLEYRFRELNVWRP